MPAGSRSQDNASAPHVTASAVAFVLAIALLAVIIVLAVNGVIDQGSGSSFAAVVAAFAAVFTLAFKLVTDELVRRQSEVRARLALAIALHAEISSNLEQQRKSLNPADVSKLISRKLSPEHKASTFDAKSSSESSGGLADLTDPIFAKAIERYDLIPEAAIHSVIDYYNLNGMLNNLVVFVSSNAFLDLNREQRQTVLRSYLELADRTDETACKALNNLRAYIDKAADSTSADLPERASAQLVILTDRDNVLLGMAKNET